MRVTTVFPEFTPGSARVKLQLCGRTLLCVEGDSVELPHRLAMLLALVALTGSVDRARVAAWLYPTVDAPAARRNLRQLLHHHRRLLSFVAEVNDAQVRLLPGVELDVVNTDLRDAGTTQEHVESTLAPLLETLDVDEHPEFSIWLQEQRSLQQQYQLDRLAVQASEHERQGRLGEALQLARRIRDADPSSERAHRRVMRLHYLRGDRAAALATFDRCEQFLKHELGVRPAPETLELLHVIEAAQRVETAAPGQRLIPVSLQRPPTTIGRAVERDALLHAWAQGGAFLLLGEAGIGKSRLLADLLQGRPSGLLIRARHGDARRPYATLSRLAQALPLRVLLSGEERRAWHWLQGGESSGSDAVLSADLIHEAMRLAIRAADHDLVLDDMHLADAASLEMLARLATDPPGAALRWGFAARPHESPGLLSLRSALADAGLLHLVHVQALQERQVEEFLASLRLPRRLAPGFASVLLRRTGGNPMFMLELLKGWCLGDEHTDLQQMKVPETVAQLVDQQIAACTPQAAALARLAALAASDFSVELCESVLGNTALALADAWRELEERQLMRQGHFAHDLIQESAARSIPGVIAQSIHARIAAFLQEYGGQPSSVASHWLAAQREEQACVPLVAAAHQAIRAGRTLEAGQFYAQAAQILQRLGDNDQAFVRYFEACEMFVDAGAAAAFDAAAAQAVPLAQSPQQRVQARLMQAFGYYVRGELKEGGARFESLLDDAIAVGERRAEAECRFEIARLWVQQGRLRDALHMASAAQTLFRELGLKAREFVAETHVAQLVMRTGVSAHYPKLSFEQLLQNAQQLPQGLDRRTGHVSQWVSPARIAANRGEFELATRLLQEGVDKLLAASMPPDMRYNWTSVCVETLNDLGRFDLALDLLQRHDARGDTYRGNWWYALAVERLILYQALGRHDLAQRHAAEIDPDDIFSHYVRTRLLLTHTPVEVAYRSEEEHLGLRIRCALAQTEEAEPHRASGLCWEALVNAARGAEFLAWLPALQARMAADLLRQGKTDQARVAAQQAHSGCFGLAIPATRPQICLHLNGVFKRLAEPEQAAAVVAAGTTWLTQDAARYVPQLFADSFIHRHPEHRTLLTAGGLG